MLRRRLYYLPGLISLVGLPILLLIWGPEDPPEKNAVRLFLPKDNTPANVEGIFASAYVLRMTKNKRIVTIDFWSEYLYDELGNYHHYRKLGFITKEFERLSFTHDTSTVLKIELGAGVTYGEWVWLLNQCMLTGVKRYALVENTFYVFATDPPENPANFPPLEVINPDYHNVVPDVPADQSTPSGWERFTRWVEEQTALLRIYLEHNYLLVAGFLVLIVIPSIIRIRRMPKILRTPSQKIP